MIVQDRRFEALLHRPLELGGVQKQVFTRLLHFWRLYHNISFSRYEPLNAELAVRLMTGGPVSRLFQAINETLPYIANFADHLAGQEVYDDDEELWMSASGQDAFSGHGVVDGAVKPKMDSFCEEIDNTFEGVRDGIIEGSRESISVVQSTKMWCEEISASVLRLHQSRREKSKWSIITEGSETQKKALKVIWGASLLAFNYFDLDYFEEIWQLENREVDKAKRTRNLLFSFRGKCLRATSEMQQARVSDKVVLVQDLLRAFDLLIQENAYGEVRARDRYAVQKHREALEQWKEGDWHDENIISEITEDIRTFFAQLSGLNRRRCLVLADEETLKECINSLQTYREEQRSGPCDERLLDGLKQLVWRDENLQEYITGLDEEESKVDFSEIIEAIYTCLMKMEFG
ncbi:MAG: hypothetical protein CMH60_06005 [Myxococcales bacterium]|nr:hypothetical protein [Myxococcales bacterium]